MRIYLDASPVIYLVERIEPYFSLIGPRFMDNAGHGVKGTIEWVTSDLTRLECRIKPVRDNDVELLGAYDEFFEAIHETITLSSHVVDEATKIRACFGFKTPDSLHLAAAMVAQCNVFLTNYHRLDKFSGLKVETF